VTGTVDLPGDESAEVAVVWPAEGDDGTPLVVVRVPEWPMTPKAARELAAALLTAADRVDGLRR